MDCGIKGMQKYLFYNTWKKKINKLSILCFLFLPKFYFYALNAFLLRTL